MLRGGQLLFAFSQHDLDFRAGQPVRLEEGTKVGTVRCPVVNHDLSGMNFKEVQAAARDNEPDDPVAIASR